MGWYTDPATHVPIHTRTDARNMREHRANKREDAIGRNTVTPASKRRAVRRVMDGGSLTEEWERIRKDVFWGIEHADMKRQMAGAVAVSERGMRKRRKTRTDHEAAKMARDLKRYDAQVSLYASAGPDHDDLAPFDDDPGSTTMHAAIEAFTIQHKTTPIPDQMTARQMDVYDMLGGM